MNMRSQIIIVFVACVFSLTGLWSCDSKKEPAKPAVVKKKIKAPAKTKARSKMAARPKRPRMRPKSDVAMIVPKAKTAQTASPGKPIVKSSVAAAPKASQPAPTASRPAMARTSGPAAQAAGGAGGADKNRVTLTPKSDIAMADTGRAQTTTPTANNNVTAEAKGPRSAAKAGTAAKPVALTPKPSAAKSSGATAKQASKGGKNTPAPYDPTGKINPFEPLFKEQPKVEAVAQKRKKRVPRTPLERISLAQLKLVGIILASSGNRALVQESSGKGYIIKKGTYIGLNAGKVTEIRKDAVVIEEEVENVLGKVTKSTKELKLPKPPGE